MSMPPQGAWQPSEQPDPAHQGQPHGQPFDPNSYNPQQQPPPPGWQQGSWAPHPGPPPPKGNSLKWLLIAVAVLLVIGISVGATLIFSRNGGNGGGTTATSGASSDIASANDTGPVSIITEDPTCETFNGINNALAGVQSNGWAVGREGLGPASEWTSDQRSQAQAVATAMRNSADQSVALAKQTPHRVVRELYEQFIAYGRAYADSVPSYTPSDNYLASVNVSAGSALTAICNAIRYGSTNRALAVEAVPPPTRLAVPGNPADPQRFIAVSDSACTAWIERDKKFDAETQGWAKLDTAITGAQWTPEQRAIQKAALPVLTAWANDMEEAGRHSNNPIFEDFAVSAALYTRAYVSSGDTYVNADSFLTTAAFRFGNTIAEACNAAAN